ncbi:glycoside hydrolase family 3 C-terminal domain-containing protein [Ruminococcaceae bacterium OttesenSCG-928-L11]|nr:glycoside hydrolase family 3 C-terminal domain-containing protein [Ruminococcaceae bacterium OttesenSCG-928-L11]
MTYKDKSQPVEKRVEDLLSQMTLEEKAAQLCGDLPGFVEEGAVNGALLREKYPDGHGRFTQYSLVGLVDPAHIARFSNEVQRYFVEETRLGIPVAFQAENLCGYPAAGGTLFPAMINVAATWRPDLAKQMSAVIGQESRAVGINSAMSPVIDVSRDPRWGRTYETFGEDPYLISQMGMAYVEGMQGDKESGVACIAKHFLGYAETQAGLNIATTRLTPRELYEMFATPFEAAAKVSDVSGMMASYSEIDGLPVAMNPAIARTLLRDTMGFRGMLISDGAAVLKLFNYFKLAGSYEEAGLLAKKAGLDAEIPVGGAFRHLPEYVRAGKLEESVLDESVRRILTIKFEYGLFDNPYVDEGRVAVSMRNDSKTALAGEMAEQSLVLLQNNGILPLKPGARLAVVGPHADSLRYPVSGYTYPAYIEMVDAGKKALNPVSFHGIADEAGKANKPKGQAGPFASMASSYSREDFARLQDMNAVLSDMGARTLKDVLSERFSVRYAEGCSLLGMETDGFAAAVQAAKESDVVVMAAGGNCGWVGSTGGEGKDRCHLDLPGVQQQLLEALKATGKPVVLVLYGPGIFALPWAAENADAILQAWMPGAGAGVAVANVLDGTRCPGGKLPVTIPRSVGQVPVTYNHRTGSGYGANSEETDASAFIFTGGYVDEDCKPLYPFGHGLSYTRFTFGDCAVGETKVATDGVVTVSCTVENTGDRAGDEVVQLYTHFRDAHVIRPVMQLAGFARVSLDKGERKTVTFRLDTAQLGYYNEDMRFVVEPGALDVLVGTSAHDILFRETVALVGETVEVMGKRAYTCPVEIQ